MPRNKISIYATVFNNANRVRQSLNSIINQFPNFSKDFDMAITDNFSTDGTWEILKEFMDKHSNITAFQTKCKKGTGRQKALEATHNDYVFSIDLDSVYQPSLSYLVRNAIKKGSSWEDRKKTVCAMIYKRETLEKIGGWRDLNVFEDTELGARAVSKGVRYLSIPVQFQENEQIEGIRDARYSKSTVGKLIRLYNSAEDTVVGNGYKNICEVKSPIKIIDYGEKIAYLGVRLKRRQVYRYNEAMTNDKYAATGQVLISPAKFGIPKKYWMFDLYFGELRSPNAENMAKQRRRIGFRSERINKFLLFYTNETDTELIRNEKKHLAGMRV